MYPLVTTRVTKVDVSIDQHVRRTAKTVMTAVRTLDHAALAHRTILLPRREVHRCRPPRQRTLLILRDLEDRRCAAYFVRYHQKGFAIWAVLFLDEQKPFR